MGHKIHPIGFRIGVNRKWVSNWYNPKLAPEYLVEDKKIRDLVNGRYRGAAISEVNIERSKEDRVSIVIRSARPGIVIGRGGSEIEKLQGALEGLTKRKVKVSIKEVMRRVMGAGAQGVKVRVSGRIGGAEIARSITMMEGRVPLQTIRANIDYGFTEARTKYGNIGVKAWVFRGEHPHGFRGEVS